MHSLPHTHTLSLNYHKIVNEEDITNAICDLRLQKEPNYTQAAKKYNLDYTTLMHCYTRQTISNYEAYSIY